MACRVDTQTSFSYNCSNDCSGKSKYFTPYPNPTHESFKVDLGMMKTEIIASLINSLGKEILFQNFNSANIISINISAPAGIYFLKIRTSEGDSEIMKIVKE